MPTRPKKFIISIQFTVLSLIIIISSLTAGLALALQYHFSRDLARTATENIFHATAQQVSERVETLDRQASNLVRTLTPLDQIQQRVNMEDQRPTLDVLAGAMAQNDNYYAIYVGYDNGDFLELVNPESSTNVRSAFDAAPHDRWIAVAVTQHGCEAVKTTTYLDQDLNVRASKTEASTYDPRERPWYQSALRNPGVIRTPPYVFALLGSPGVTYAQELPQGQGVVAVDISLEGLHEFLARQRLFPGSEAFLFDANGDVISHNLTRDAAASDQDAASLELTPEEAAFVRDHPVIRASNEMNWPPFDFALSGKPKGYSIDLLDLLAAKAGLRVEYVNGYTWPELVELFEHGDLDLLHSLFRSTERETMGLFTEPYLAMPQALVMRAGDEAPDSLDGLAGLTVAIPHGWATGLYLQENRTDIGLLWVDTSLDALRAVARGDADAAMDSRPVLQYLMDAYFIEDLQLGPDLPPFARGEDESLHFLARNDMPQLRSILDKALLALTSEERARLDEAWLGQGDMAQDQAAGAAVTGTVPRQLMDLAMRSDGEQGLKVLDISGTRYFSSVFPIRSDSGLREYIGFLAPVRETSKPFMDKVRVSVLITLGMLLLLAPLVWLASSLIVKPINALALESDKVRERRYDEVTRVKSRIKEIIGLSRSMVSMAESIKAYEESQRELMDSFIRLIALAIDEKSHYTGGHCSRVPQLAFMIAKAASQETSGPFADFSLDGEEEWREFHVAAWLHDCGKVTTPEHIVDKGTKLEIISNRIHEIRTRFEVLLRDAEVDYWRDIARGDGDPENLLHKLEKERETLKEEFAFVAACNVGSEYLPPENKERIKAIARRTWVRHLDDQLGLSHVEAARYPQPRPDLPCTEQLLSDRPEHIIPRPPSSLPETKDLKITMQAPEHLYNQGEIHNLCIDRGTLTPEDRYKINEHIIATIRMLETLPFPENLARVPEWAGGHHETLVGTGYPRGLDANKLSIPARILALADVFEALTASDRPYKKAKKLSETLRILSFMCKDRHIDADLFKFFLKKNLHMEYARTFLSKDQIDEVDVSQYLRQTP